MSEIKLDKHQRSDALDKLIKYFNDEMQQDIGQFEAEFLLDFISKEVGNFFYNQGLQDAAGDDQGLKGRPEPVEPGWRWAVMGPLGRPGYPSRWRRRLG